MIGTSGYHFPDWTGPFYPPGLGKDRWLSFYSERFPAVEINSTYYRLPKASAVERWSEESPDDFRFIVKLNRATTHERAGDCEETAQLIDLLEPLEHSGKLHGLLGQFPASFHAGPGERKYLESLSRRTGGIPLFIELRHASWDSDGSVELCRELGLGWVAVDQPKIAGLAGTRPAVAGDLGYVRFHGRNAKTWYNPKAGDRYDWDYSESELREWIPRLEALSDRAETTYLFFNNCHAGQAIKSAALMKRMLDQQFEVF